jgi:hypothetical protein
VVAALAVCFGLRSLLQQLSPNLTRMPQLQEPMVTLVIEGAVAATVVFVLFASFVPRPIFWYRIAAVVALLLSWAPDIALGLGGTPMRLAMRYVSPLTSLSIPGLSQPGGPPPGGPPPGAQVGGPPPGFLSAMPIQQVLVLMLLHAAVALVCVVMLTTLTRVRTARD